ncbi:MAG: alpha/beta hydrolase [Clostridia bacterium]|nr:alpha/beta hydrolase [Clostridia bacterium]
MGSIVRRLMPAMTHKMLVKQNRILDRWLKGRWLGRHTQMTEKEIHRPDGSSLRLCVIEPRHPAPSPQTGLLWIHGGGYAIGLPEQDFLFADLFAKDGSCTLVMPDYTRATEKPYPAALEDCYQALLWMKEHAQQLGIRQDQLFVGGDSAGGGLAAALCLYARDKGEDIIAFQMPLYPMLDDRMVTPSSCENDAPVWNSRSNREAWDLYLQGVGETPPYAAPARAENLHALPPAFSFVGDLDPFYDETVSYFNGLKKAGVKAELRVFKGCYHAFDLMCYPSRLARQARGALWSAFKEAQISCHKRE